MRLTIKSLWKFDPQDSCTQWPGHNFCSVFGGPVKTTVSPTVHWLATVFWKICEILKKVTINRCQIKYFHAFATTYWAWRIKWPHAHIFYKRNMVLGMPIQTVANYIKGCGFNKFIDRSHNLKNRQKYGESYLSCSSVILQFFVILIMH